MSSPYDENNADERSYCHITEIYENILPALADRLNRLHKVNHAHRYWRIMLGPWLQLYLSVTYDHFLHIQTAMVRYPSFTTIGLSRESFVTPIDTMHHVEITKNDLYNLQIYTNIMHFMGMCFPLKPLASAHDNAPQKSGGKLFPRFVTRIAEGVTNVCTSSRHTLHLQASYFKKSHSGSSWRITLAEFGRAQAR